jgi:hypothetical protein
VKEKNPVVLTEIEGVVVGHRDGHGFVVRDDGQPDIYLPPNEMRAVLHKDRVRVRIVRQDRRGRPEGRVTEILARADTPIIGRLLHEGGVWLVAPEDKRYGQDVLIPKGATGSAQPGQVVVVELTEPPALYGQPVGRVKEVLGDIDDPGMEIEIAVRKYGVPHRFSEATVAEARALPDRVRAYRPARPCRSDRRAAGHDRWGGCARFRRCGVLRTGARRSRQGLAAAGGHRRRQPLCAQWLGVGCRCLRARHQRVFSASRHSDAAGEALQRVVLAQPRRGPLVHGV